MQALPDIIFPGISLQGIEANAKMPEYNQAIEKFLSDNPNLGKAALVQLLTARFPNLSKAEAWTLVAHYCNDKGR